MPQVTIDLTELPRLTNEAFYPFYNNRDRCLVLYGGAGSGKSVFACQKLLVRALSEEGHRFLIVRKVARTLRNSVFAQLLEVIGQWGLRKFFKVNKSDMEITCRNASRFIFVGLDDVEKLKSITGITGIWIEEASEITEDDFHQLNLRLRGQTEFYKQIVLSFNPVSALSWLKKHFFDTPQKGATCLKTTYLDNKWLDEDYIQVLKELKDKDHVYYQVYALGEWGELGNLVFTNYVIEEIPDKYPHEYGGLDFGYNNPSCLLRIGEKDGEIYVYDELYQKGLTNNELISEVEKVFPKDRLITADSAEPDRIEEFRQAGFHIQGAAKGKGSVKVGLDFLKRHKIHIHPRCVNFIKEIRGYKYREDKDGNVYDEPLEFNDHAMSALRYGAEPIMQAVGPLDFKLTQSLTRVSPWRR
jgi:phage terminase large subunit